MTNFPKVHLNSKRCAQVFNFSEIDKANSFSENQPSFGQSGSKTVSEKDSKTKKNGFQNCMEAFRSFTIGCSGTLNQPQPVTQTIWQKNTHFVDDRTKNENGKNSFRSPKNYSEQEKSTFKDMKITGVIHDQRMRHRKTRILKKKPFIENTVKKLMTKSTPYKRTFKDLEPSERFKIIREMCQIKKTQQDFKANKQRNACGTGKLSKSSTPHQLQSLQENLLNTKMCDTSSKLSSMKDLCSMINKHNHTSSLMCGSDLPREASKIQFFQRSDPFTEILSNLNLGEDNFVSRNRKETFFEFLSCDERNEFMENSNICQSLQPSYSHKFHIKNNKLILINNSNTNNHSNFNTNIDNYFNSNNQPNYIDDNPYNYFNSNNQPNYIDDNSYNYFNNNQMYANNNYPHFLNNNNHLHFNNSNKGIYEYMQGRSTYRNPFKIKSNREASHFYPAIDSNENTPACAVCHAKEPALYQEQPDPNNIPIDHQTPYRTYNQPHYKEEIKESHDLNTIPISYQTPYRTYKKPHYNEDIKENPTMRSFENYQKYGDPFYKGLYKSYNSLKPFEDEYLRYRNFHEPHRGGRIAPGPSYGGRAAVDLYSYPNHNSVRHQRPFHDPVDYYELPEYYDYSQYTPHHGDFMDGRAPSYDNFYARPHYPYPGY